MSSDHPVNPGNSKRSKKPAWLFPVIVIVVASVLIAVTLLRGQSGDEAVPEQGAAAEVTAPGEDTQDRESPQDMYDRQAPLREEVERRDADDALAMGPVDAPVALVVFSDYQCPYCAKWNAETLPELQPHIDAGKLRVEWRDVNVFGEDSARGARAAYAAGQQDRFWDYHEVLFANGESVTKRQLTDDHLIALAEEMGGFDMAKFRADFASPETAAAVDDNAMLGLQLGVASTPSFVLGGQPIVGAQPASVFESVFDMMLTAAEAR